MSSITNIVLHPDADLIELGQRLNVACDALRRSADDKFEMHCAALDPIEDAIAAQRATTIDGLAVKARAATRWGITPGDIADSMAKSIVRDLLEFDSEARLIAPRKIPV